MQSTNPPEPNLTSTPTHVSQCCVSLSTKLLQTLSSLLGTEGGGLCLSIGSGSGLLEHLLLQSATDLNVVGVELHGVNVYLQEHCVEIVNHSGAVSALAAESTVWMFVYPRSSKLLAEYVCIYGKGTVKLVIMILPRCDKSEMTEQFLCSWSDMEVEQAGLVGWECMILLRKKKESQSATRERE